MLLFLPHKRKKGNEITRSYPKRLLLHPPKPGRPHNSRLEIPKPGSPEISKPGSPEIPKPGSPYNRRFEIQKQGIPSPSNLTTSPPSANPYSLPLTK